MIVTVSTKDLILSTFKAVKIDRYFDWLQLVKFVNIGQCQYQKSKSRYIEFMDELVATTATSDQPDDFCGD